MYSFDGICSYGGIFVIIGKDTHDGIVRMDNSSFLQEDYSMIKLYLVRHGETDGNVQQWYQGSTDVPLNERCIAQATCLSRFLRHVHFDGIYSGKLTLVSGKDIRIKKLQHNGQGK